MCIAFFGLDAWPADPDLHFLLLFGRDEFLARPTQPAHFWPDEPLILAGRDMQAKGTWLGVSPNGRIAFLTNLRERDPDPAPCNGQVQAARHGTRGALTTGFLLGTDTPLQYLQGVTPEAYHGFNLVVVDLKLGELAYTANPFPNPSPAAALDVPTPATASVTVVSGLEPAAEATAHLTSPLPSEPQLSRTVVEDAGQRVGHATTSSGSGTAASAQCCPHPPPQPGAGQLLGSCQQQQKHSHAGEGHAASGGSTAWQTGLQMRRKVLGGPLALQPGVVYGLSNGLLDEWPKVRAGVRDLKMCMRVGSSQQRHNRAADLQQQQQEAQAPEHSCRGAVEQQVRVHSAKPARGLRQCQAEQAPPPAQQATPAVQGLAAYGDGGVSRPLPWDELFSRVLGDRSKDESLRAHVPLGGCLGGQAGAMTNAQYVFSSRFIEVADMGQLGDYGTRSQTVLAVWKDGHAELRERCLDTASMEWKESGFTFDMALGGKPLL